MLISLNFEFPRFNFAYLVTSQFKFALVNSGDSGVLPFGLFINRTMLKITHQYNMSVSLDKYYNICQNLMK